MNPLDLQRLAVRIESLQQVRTHDWDNADAMEFRNLLPTGRDRRKVPDPKTLRQMAQDGTSPPMSDWNLWVTMTMQMEGMTHQNDPRNSRNMIRRMVRGQPF